MVWCVRCGTMNQPDLGYMCLPCRGKFAQAILASLQEGEPRSRYAPPLYAAVKRR